MNGDDGWSDLHAEAERIVRGKFVWRRFIDGTPLANDVPVWMVEFAMMVRRRERESYTRAMEVQLSGRRAGDA